MLRGASRHRESASLLHKMLTKFLANSFVGLIELLMWIIVIFGTLLAVEMEVTGTGHVFADAGLGLILSLLFAAIIFGPIMMIIDLKKSVSNIEAMLSQKD